jgi:hypothetical protein
MKIQILDSANMFNERGGVMRSLKKEKIIGMIGFLALGVLFVAFTTNCKSEKKAETKGREAIELSMLIPIFGDPQNDQSGVVDVQQTDEGLILAYHFATEEKSDFDDDIGRDLGPKIREFYKKFPQADQVVFGVSLPTTLDVAGWESYVSFTMTRKLVEETDWTQLLDDDLLKVALDVKYAE